MIFGHGVLLLPAALRNQPMKGRSFPSNIPGNAVGHNQVSKEDKRHMQQ